MDLIITILPVVTKDLPISPRFTPYNFLSRCKFSTLTTRQPTMVEFYLLTFPRFPLRKKEHKSYFGKNRTHDFRTSRCAGYLLDHSGDEGRTTKYVVCCCCLHTKSRSDLYSVPSNIRTGLTDANAFRGHRLTTQKGYTYAAYKTRNIFLKKLLYRKRRFEIFRLCT